MNINEFIHEIFGSVHAFIENGNTWFLLADLTSALQIERVRMERFDPEDQCSRAIITRGGTQNMVFVNESAMYELVITSRRPEAREFKKWLTHTVLPSIRKTGGYIAGQEDLNRDDLHALEEQIRNLRASVERANAGKKKLSDYLNAEEDRTSLLIGWCAEYRQKLDAMEAELKALRQAVKNPTQVKPTKEKTPHRVKTVIRVAEPDPMVIGPNGMVIRLSELLSIDFSR